jgi:pimeloyl-ACP methyl ester carboxylesterase
MRPDLTRVYKLAPKPKRAVILVPGVFGSKLKDERTGKLIWGRAASFFRKLYRPLDLGWDSLDLPVDAEDPLTNDDSLKPAGIFDEVAGHEYYARVINTLRDAGKYVPGDILHPKAGESLFSFDYDWRKDSALTAARLAKAIDRILAARGEPDGQVDIVGHSLGALIARYYIRYGGADVLGSDRTPPPTFAGAKHVHTLVLMAAPNSGTVDALRSLLEGTSLGRHFPPEAIFTMPAPWQLLPLPGAKVIVDSEGETLDADLFDIKTWEKFKWSAFSEEAMGRLRESLEARDGRGGTREAFDTRMAQVRRFGAWALLRAKRFISALVPTERDRDTVHYVAFGGDCLPTPARAVVVFDGKEHHTYFLPEEMPRALRSPKLEQMMVEPGDGSVTRASLQGWTVPGVSEAPRLPLASTWVLCETHRHITENIAFHDNLLNVLVEPSR